MQNGPHSPATPRPVSREPGRVSRSRLAAPSAPRAVVRLSCPARFRSTEGRSALVYRLRFGPIADRALACWECARPVSPPFRRCSLASLRQSRTRGCRGPHDCSCDHAGPCRATAMATKGSSPSGPIGAGAHDRNTPISSVPPPLGGPRFFLPPARGGRSPWRQCDRTDPSVCPRCRTCAIAQFRSRRWPPQRRHTTGGALRAS